MNISEMLDRSLMQLNELRSDRGQTKLSLKDFPEGTIVEHLEWSNAQIVSLRASQSQNSASSWENRVAAYKARVRAEYPHLTQKKPAPVSSNLKGLDRVRASFEIQSKQKTK